MITIDDARDGCKRTYGNNVERSTSMVPSALLLELRLQLGLKHVTTARISDRFEAMCGIGNDLPLREEIVARVFAAVRARRGFRLPRSPQSWRIAAASSAHR
jgi:hypothetical protein